MSWKSISHIASEAGVTTRTVNKYCEELPRKHKGKAILLETKEAYRAIFERRSNNDLDLQQERARLAKEQADKYEIENALKKKSIVDADEIAEAWQEVAAAVRSKLLALPVKIARVAVAADGLAEIEQAAKKEINAALAELAAHESDN